MQKCKHFISLLLSLLASTPLFATLELKEEAKNLSTLSLKSPAEEGWNVEEKHYEASTWSEYLHFTPKDERSPITLIEVLISPPENARLRGTERVITIQSKTPLIKKEELPREIKEIYWEFPSYSLPYTSRAHLGVFLEAFYSKCFIPDSIIDTIASMYQIKEFGPSSEVIIQESKQSAVALASFATDQKLEAFFIPRLHGIKDLRRYQTVTWQIADTLARQDYSKSFVLLLLKNIQDQNLPFFNASRQLIASLELDSKETKTTLAYQSAITQLLAVSNPNPKTQEQLDKIVQDFYTERNKARAVPQELNGLRPEPTKMFALIDLARQKQDKLEAQAQQLHAQAQEIEKLKHIIKTLKPFASSATEDNKI